MEWKEGNTAKARELYQRALSINASSESAARCLQVTNILLDDSLQCNKCRNVTEYLWSHIHFSLEQQSFVAISMSIL